MCFCSAANHLCFCPARLSPFPVASSRRSGAADRALGVPTALLGPQPCPGDMQVGRLMTLRCWQSFIPSLASRSDLPEIFFLLCLGHLRRASGASHLVPLSRQDPAVRFVQSLLAKRSSTLLLLPSPPINIWPSDENGTTSLSRSDECFFFRRSADLTRAKSPW